MIENFAALILTHGRPDKVFTFNTLRRRGYKGPIYLVVDNEDKTLQQYVDKYGDKVIVFDKLAESEKTDEFDNFADRRCILHARNASFEIAKTLGYKYFIQLDDDYTNFEYKVDAAGNYPKHKFTCHHLDEALSAYIEYFKLIEQRQPILSLAMAQNGDFIGGGGSVSVNRIKRKAMNSFICSTERSFKFFGRINEDVNVYTTLGCRGKLFLTATPLALKQVATQKNSGGMSDMYLDSGTYIKSFYTVMTHPSGVKISEMGNKEKRIHHRVLWRNTVPQIIAERYSKK